ncbi:gliding motility-associated C-terminal domain-containing protein, partial [Sabulilitoribacter multivorans]
DSASATIPELCNGGTATVTWTITDLCETINVSADFSVTAPTAITYTAPVDDSSTASEFDDPDPVVAQSNLDADFDAWLADQNATINGSVVNGCNPVITNDYAGQRISFCISDSITVTWIITDLCETINVNATYTFTQPDGINFTDPSSKTANSCDFDNDDITIAQANVDNDIATWVADQTNIINSSLTGGSPDVSHDYNNETIDICTGGAIVVNWTIEDICETINRSATYTLVAPTAITYTAPVNDSSDACDYADQSEVDTAFNNWVAAQTSAFAIANGCSPVLTNDSASVTIPELCNGGTATVTWTITDLCETINVSADFSVTAPTAITYTAPVNDSSDACEFDTNDLTNAQNELDADLASWVNDQTTIINGSFANGCSPTVSNDFSTQSIDFCTGGSVIITWTITDKCQTFDVSATYTFTQPSATTFDQTLPTDMTVECDSVPTADALTASNTCGDISVVYDETRTDGDCPNSYSLLRTWTATNICGVTIEHNQTITVIDSTPPVLTLPNNVTAECSDDLSPINFGEATATDNCDPNPVVTFNDVRTDGACSGTYTITRTWTATDSCGNVSTADQIISTSDTTAPEFDQTSLPGDVVVECDGVPSPVVLTASDNCGSAVVTVNDVRNDGNCDFNYTITRTYTATDECGLTKTHVQTITVQDTTPPTFVEALPVTNIVVECDSIPTPQTLTAVDSCGSAVVTVSDTRTDGICPNSYTLTRTWTATDECGLTTTHSQNIIVQDTTPPTFVEALPSDMTVECDNIPDVTSITATDNCGSATVTVNDIRTDGDCPSNYFIARTWIATDECGLTTTHTQIITVQDTTAPVPTTSYEATLDVSCTDIPDAPVLEFEDNCSANIVVVYNETNSFDENVFVDYQIVRTWTVRDACNNEAVYTQTLNVTLDEVYSEVVAEDRCFDEGIVNLNDIISDTLNTNGTWELLEGNPDATLNGSIFDPTQLKLAADFLPGDGGIDYRFRYTTTHEGCISITEVIMNIHADCVVLPCGENDIVISKAITPNGDGYNETFDIAGIDLCGFVAEVKIFNRWGALVYESNNYTLGSIETSGAQGDWNGSSPKSSIGASGKLPNGTYYYIIKLQNSGLSPLTGPVYLGTR